MLVAVGGEGNAIFVFDLRANTTRVLRGHDKLVRALALSPDGKLLVSGSDDATLRLWVIDGGNSQLLHRFGESVQAVAFSADGKRAAGASTDHTAWAGELQIERCLPTDPGALAERFEQLTSVTIDGARLLQGRTDGATTQRNPRQ
jgi:WD40 repeat protein